MSSSLARDARRSRPGQRSKVGRSTYRLYLEPFYRAAERRPGTIPRAPCWRDWVATAPIAYFQRVMCSIPARKTISTTHLWCCRWVNCVSHCSVGFALPTSFRHSPDGRNRLLCVAFRRSQVRGGLVSSALSAISQAVLECSASFYPRGLPRIPAVRPLRPRGVRDHIFLWP
jgi:hypothetical protein